jgi:hypothetical protein
MTGSVYSSVHSQRFAYSNQEVPLAIDEIGSVQSTAQTPVNTSKNGSSLTQGDETAANSNPGTQQVDQEQNQENRRNTVQEAITWSDLLPDMTALCDEFFSELE